MTTGNCAKQFCFVLKKRVLWARSETDAMPWPFVAKVTNSKPVQSDWFFVWDFEI